MFSRLIYMRYHVIKQQKIKSEKLKQAKKMRKEMTVAERVFWEYVRKRRFPGLRFRRQQVIEGFIVDFYCAKLRTVIEIDGEIHNTRKEYDEKRDAILKGLGLRILRFTNEEVLNNVEEVVREVVGETPPATK